MGNNFLGGMLEVAFENEPLVVPSSHLEHDIVNSTARELSSRVRLVRDSLKPLQILRVATDFFRLAILDVRYEHPNQPVPKERIKQQIDLFIRKLLIITWTIYKRPEGRSFHTQESFDVKYTGNNKVIGVERDDVGVKMYMESEAELIPL